ncbi:hypothetical protein M3Y96_00549400 [Aphelenchoides besseyi]|nr:hypothetical protein M3Y96_00549400 [Aphelenchoides besseyi]
MNLSRLCVCIAALFDKRVLNNDSIFLTEKPFMYVEMFRIAAGCSAVASMSWIMSYVIINRWNSNRLRNSRKNTTTLSLTQRYQLQETIWLMTIIRRWILAFVTGMTFVIVTFAIGLLTYKKSESNTIFYLRSLGNLLCAFGGTFMLTVALSGCHAWREDIKKEFGKCRARRVTDIQPQRRVLTNFKGQHLLFDVMVERDIHFGQLQEAWN